MRISDNIMKWIILGIVALVVGFGLGCGGGDDGNGETFFVSPGEMTGIFEYTNLDIAADIGAEPSNGPVDAPCTITFRIFQGEDLVEKIETYECGMAGSFVAVPEHDPEKDLITDLWTFTGKLSEIQV